MFTNSHLRLPALLLVLLTIAVLPSQAQNTIKTPQPTAETTEDELILDFGDRDANDWENWIDVLTENGLIAGDGELLFEGEMLSTALTSPFRLYEDSETDYRSFAGGGLVSFRPGDEVNNLCGYALALGSIPAKNSFENLVVVGMNAFDEVVVFNYSREIDQEDWLVASAPAPNDIIFHNPNYFHFVLNDNLVTVFLNGISVINAIELDLPEREVNSKSGSNLVGTVLEFSCVMTNAWIYGFE